MIPSLLAALAAVLAQDTPEDEVTVRAESSGFERTVRGTVGEYDGRALRIVLSTGVVREYPAGEVVRVVTPQSADHLAGLAAVDAGEWETARAKLTAALRTEPRAWVRREILASLVSANLALGDRVGAGDRWLSVVRSDPRTPHFGRVPLPWDETAGTGELASAAARWRSDGEPGRLLAASVRLLGENGDAAAEELDDLTASPDDRVARLAEAQLWRREVFGEAPAGFPAERRADRLRLFPDGLTAGPRYLLGRAFEANGNTDRAVELYLWPPTVGTADASLAADALLRAGALFAERNDRPAAARLWREAVQRFPNTPGGRDAKERLTGD